MPSLEIDELLARLYVDAMLRSEFLDDRQRFALRYGCDVELVTMIEPGELEFFAHSLVRKRANEARKLIPLTVSILGDDFESVFDRFAAGSIPAGYNKHFADALAFCQHVIAERGDCLAGEAASFEYATLRLKLRCVSEGGNPHVFRASVRTLPWIRLAGFSGRLRALLEKRSVDAPAKRMLVLFLSIPGLSGIWYW